MAGWGVQQRPADEHPWIECLRRAAPGPCSLPLLTAAAALLAAACHLPLLQERGKFQKETRVNVGGRASRGAINK